MQRWCPDPGQGRRSFLGAPERYLNRQEGHPEYPLFRQVGQGFHVCQAWGCAHPVTAFLQRTGLPEHASSRRASLWSERHGAAGAQTPASGAPVSKTGKKDVKRGRLPGGVAGAVVHRERRGSALQHLVPSRGDRSQRHDAGCPPYPDNRYL